MQYLRTPREVINPNFIRDDIQKEQDNSVAYQLRQLNDKFDKLISLISTTQEKGE